MKTVVYDIEIFPNFFSYLDVDIETGEEKLFVIHESRNDLEAMIHYNCLPKLRIGFNNLYFDAPVLEMVMNNYSLFQKLSPQQILNSLYNQVQIYIQNEKKEKFQGKYEIDLFLINHYNNKARSTSLKALQCSIYWENVQDMPLKFNEPVPDDLIEEVIKYNRNDVLSTKAFYEVNLDKIEFRKELSRVYKKNMINFPDITIGEEIFLQYIKKESGLNRNELKSKIKFDKEIDLNKCILPYIKFNSDEFNDLLKKVRWTVVNDANKLKYNVTYRGFRYDFGVGGIHGCITPGVYNSDDQKIIIDYDVKSYYPNLAIQNGLHPKHIPKDVFINVYRKLFDERVEAQKAKDKVKDDGFKLSLNGVFGKTGESTSAFFDRYYFYSITLNGQLTLAMLAEWYADGVPDIEILQINTDGITIRCNRSSINTLEAINKRFMKLTGLILESNDYKKMVIFNVNNYLAVSMKEEIKRKGIFETVKDFHKDNSFLVVPKALEKYFLENIPIEITVKENTNIYDFCGRYKATKGWHAEYNYSKDNTVITENHGKVLRFYSTTKDGGTSFKVCEDGRVHHLLANQKTVLFNRYFSVPNFEDYNLHYEFYFRECYKIIDEIEPKQLILF